MLKCIKRRRLLIEQPKMLRAFNLPPVAALRLSLVPTLPLSSASSNLSSRVSTFVSSEAFFLKTLLVPSSASPSPSAYYIPSFSLKQFRPMAAASAAGHRHSPKATASYSAGSSSGGQREVLVQHLLVKEDDLKLLVELQKRLSEGEDLSDLALEYSICPSKEEGGMLGWVRKGQMVLEFEEAAFKAPVNRIVRCKTKFGWHLLQVLSEREESVLQDIQPDELHVKMQDPCFFEEVQLIDVREPDEVAQASLPGFEILPLRQFGSWGPEIATKFDSQKDTYVLCHHGIRSLQVAKWLQTQGFKRVFNVSGGIHAYAVKADPSIPTY